MRIVFLNRFFHPDESATSQLLTDLAVHLATAGHEVHIVTSRQMHHDPRAGLPRRDTHQGVDIHRVRTTRFGRFNLAGRAIDYVTFYIAATVQLAVLARPGDIVIAKTDPPLISVVAAVVCRFRKACLVNWVQDLFPEVAQRLGVRLASGGIGRMLARLRDYSLRSARLNVALGERMASQLRAHAPDTPAEVVHNWADGRSVVPIEPCRNSLRHEWGVVDRFVVGYSGNMGRAHDFSTILGACEHLRDRTDIVFVMIGAGPQRAHLQAQVRQRALPNVMFQPFQARDRLPMSLSVPDVHLVSLQPALEGLIVPSKFYGIAAAGRPTIVIGSRDGEIAQLLRDGACGISIETGDVAGLANGIRAMSDDPASTRRMGANARVLFDQRFDLAHAMHRWEALLARMRRMDY